MPSNYDNLDLAAIECGECVTSDCLGAPGGSLCANFQYTYHDHILPICAGSYTIVRKWKVLDMCTSTLLEHNQIIKVIDSDGPEVTCPEDVTIYGNVFDCEGSAIVDLPTITPSCAEANVSNIDIQLSGPAITTFAGSGYVISEAPLGVHVFTYTVTDDCGMAVTCDFTVTVLDKVPPTPVCDENTEVSLTSDGTAIVFATTFDDGSHDNCSPVVWFKVIRTVELCGTGNGFTGIFNQCLACGGLNANDGDDDLARVGVQVYFDDYVKFCCEDVNAEEQLTVTLRVYDVDPGEGPVDPSRMVEGGDLWCHFNDCIVDIDVQDNLNPFIVCPNDIDYDCNEDIDYEALNDINDDTYGIAVVVSQAACGAELEVTVEEETLSCGAFEITRTFTYGTAYCTQTILLSGDNNPFTIDNIDWADDMEIEGCPEDLSETPPGLDDDRCADLLISYDDQIFVREQDACIKILRTWKVLDWCQYDENTGAGIWTDIQVIKLFNTAAPEFYEGCEDIVICDTVPNADCTIDVDLVVNAASACGDSVNLTYGYQIDAFYDPLTPFEVDFFGSSNDATDAYPIGVHKIRWTVTDGCGNTNTCEYTFDLSDCKKPSPKCFSGLVTVVMEGVGEVTIWASEFDAGSDDNCGDVTASFSEDVNDIFRTFTCDDISSPVTLPVWFTDASGNQDFCETFIIIQDNDEVCPDSFSAIISGLALTEMEDGVDGVEMTLTNESISQVQSGSTDLAGEYVFWPNPLLNDYTVEGFSNDDPKNGISTLDIVKIQKHLLGLETFTSAYQSVAADVNNSKSVSALDMVELRKLLLGVYDEFPNNTSWRFVDETQTFSDIHDPWPLDEIVEIDNLNDDMYDENFVSIKVGDLNNSATPNALVSTEDRTVNDYLAFVAADAKMVVGQTYDIAITAENFDAVLGYQFTLNFNTDLEFVGFEAGALEVVGGNFGLNRLDQGILTTSWNDGKPVTVASNEVLFTLSFVAKAEGMLSNMIHVGSQITSAEAYSRTSEDLGITMNFRSDNGQVVEAFELMQNVPNPFDQETVIGFNLPKDAEVTFTINDVNGKSVFTKVGDYVKGYNQITVERSDLNASGVVLYTIETSEFTSTKKMILID